ncbi:MAG: pentapeptide repeat-containing protein, partial [Kovacikia sp.]
LVTRNGSKKSYVEANLRGANLNGVDLKEANLKWADLSEAILRHADLRGADLTETLVLGTDFTGASLTGACLEGWNIDDTTNLENVDCQFVYLKRNQQERRPSSGDFAPGEFTKLFQEVLSTVDLIFRNGVDWKAFVAAFKQVQVENENTPLEIQSIENKGDGVVVVRVSVPPETNKEKIHSEFNQQYDLALKALEAKYRAELQAKEGEIAIYREQSGNMWGVINSLANRPINVQAISEAKAMNDSTDSSRKIEIGNIGGDFHASGQALNLGDISGTVTNTINQLPDAAEPGQPNLKQLLMELQAAIATDTDLPDTDKADLLEQVQNLAEAKQTEEPAKKEGLVRKAKKMFDATLSNLPETAKIAEACSKLLPLILKVLGFAV